MAEYIIQDSTLAGIADAIREKTGGTEAIGVANMASEIAGIEAGGGGAPDAFFAIQFAYYRDAPKQIEVFPFVTGMTWMDYYNSFLDPYITASNGGKFACKIDDTPSYDGYPCGYFYDPMYNDLLVHGRIENADGTEASFDDVIQPMDMDAFTNNETITPLYMCVAFP